MQPIPRFAHLSQFTLQEDFLLKGLKGVCIEVRSDDLEANTVLLPIPTSRESLKERRETGLEQKKKSFIPTIQIGTFNESTTNYEKIIKKA